ncbi:MAG: hypothetical protein EA424_05885 [Planctomycetaceae bacterium]|nr:MAG: hypothetical protein EA424_05885 [Planctomycetaceae bacterium]
MVRSSSFFRFRAPTARFVLVLVLWAVGGCSALQLDRSNNDLSFEDVAGGASSQANSPVGTVKIEIRAAGRSPEVRELPIRDGMFIDDALTDSGLKSRFRRMELSLLRYNEHGLAKMDSRYEHKMGKVHPRFDYGLRPGDHLLVTEDTSTMLHDMLNGLSPIPGAMAR